ncbi:MAG TPA: hypothetical protein VH518_13940, partial [Tepidisphaeraceae bacterium]
RNAAGEALQAMVFALPNCHADFADMDASGGMPDLKAHRARLDQAVRDAVEQPHFPKAIFVRRLMLFRMAIDDDWRNRTAQLSSKDQTYDRRETELIERILTSADESERKKAGKRFRRLFCASLERDTKIMAGAQTTQPAGHMSYMVFEALDSALLAAPDVLEEMLQQHGTRRQALEALARIGPPARAFALPLLAELESLKKDYFEAPEALGAIGQDDPAIVDRLLRLLQSGSEAQRTGAIQTLDRIGPHLAGRGSDVISQLLKSLQADPNLRWAALSAIASVGRDDERALAIVLDFARPRPPVMKSTTHSPGYQYDEAMAHRAAAISALAHFKAFADRVMPVLVDARANFQEFDPDWQSQGEHARVNHVISRLRGSL